MILPPPRFTLFPYTTLFRSVGVNWNSPNSASGVTNFQSDLQTLFIKFDDSCPANGLTATWYNSPARSEEHTSELQSLRHLVCRLLLEKKKDHHLHQNQ